ncbi:MAG TPA: exonuclease domain-containing protein [Allosphingosinicella sp.]|nr:exonuclease domain-containing protein [Allosphingosinicella sp.]
MGFVFYDTETTGTNLDFDQILQFAAIRTDHDLVELDRFEIRCRLLPHVVPHPKALTVTRVSMDQLLDSSLPTHYEMMCQIAERLSAWSPAIFIGWNTLEFDEALLRQALFQCLHPPYLTNTDGNCRADLMKLAQALGLLQPGVLQVPTGPNGKLTYKLDLLAPANGFNHSNAHDALADVEATIHIGRIVRDAAGDHWSDAIRFSQKAAASTFIDEEPAFLITECYFGNAYQFALVKIAVDPDNPSSAICFDLDVNPDELQTLSHDALVSRLGRKIKPIRRVRLNAAPILHELSGLPSFHGAPIPNLIARAEKIRSDQALCDRLVLAAKRAEREVSEHVEQRIHGTFSGDADKARMLQFHASDWPSRAIIVETFDDDRLIELGRRLIFHHAPDALDASVRSEVEVTLARRVTGHGHVEPPWLTLAVADGDAVKQLAECNEDEAAIVNGVRAYIAERLNQCAPHLAD